MTTTKAFAYLRVSGRSQAAEGPRQPAAINAYSAAHGLAVAHVFKERGVRGNTESLDRPAWTAMLAEILGNGSTLKSGRTPGPVAPGVVSVARNWPCAPRISP